jgi:hypothetical protein
MTAVMAAVIVLCLPTVVIASQRVTERVSTGPAESGGSSSLYQTNVSPAGVSADGSHIAFTTDRRLVPEDTDDSSDVYVRSGNSIELASPGSNGDIGFAGMSRDGSRVFLMTTEALLPEDIDGSWDYYEYAGGTMSLISTRPFDPHGQDDPAASLGGLEITPDGLHAFFITNNDSGTNGVRGDSDDRIFATQGVYVP